MAVVLCGGGTAGHVLPNIGLIEFLQDNFAQHKLYYLIEKNGIEKSLLEDVEVQQLAISAGKIRRYFSLHNLLDLCKIPLGLLQSLKHLYHIKPKLIISNGGYVSVPVLLAGCILRIPIIHHEADASISLTSRLATWLAQEIWCQHTDLAIAHHNKHAVQLPLRRAITESQKANFAYKDYLRPDKPTILVMGGSLGAKFVNDFIHNNLKAILENFNLIHLTGLKQPEVLEPHPGYVPLKFSQNIGELYQNADFFIGRAGASCLKEIAYFNLRSVLIPLPLTSSRGEQYLNAQKFVETQQGQIIEQAKFNLSSLCKALDELSKKPPKAIDKSLDRSKLYSRLSLYLESAA